MNNLKKPDLSFTKLIEALRPSAELVAPQKPGEPTAGVFVDNNAEFAKIFLLSEGYAHIRRRDDNLTMCTVFSPYIMGVSFYPGSRIYYSIELGPNSCLYQLSRIQAFNVVKREGLYREWMNALSYKLALLYERDRNVFRHNSEDIVSRMLMRLMELPMNIVTMFQLLDLLSNELLCHEVVFNVFFLI
ncbi:hypothetical protein GGER_16090 [Serratia rubidaea]